MRYGKNTRLKCLFSGSLEVLLYTVRIDHQIVHNEYWVYKITLKRADRQKTIFRKKTQPLPQIGWDD